MTKGKWSIKSKEMQSILTKEFLEEQNKIKEVKQIAEEVGCSRSTIRKYSYMHKVPLYNSRVGKQKGEENPLWAGEEIIREGRVFVYDSVLCVRKRKHIYVMEQYIGGRLYIGEIVHHLNGNPLDNDISNLILMEKNQHDRYHLIMRNKNKNYDKHDASKVLETLNNFATIKMKIYAELTRIVKV